MSNTSRIEAIGSLTKIKLEILALVAEGWTNKEIAAVRGTSDNTVKWHLRIIADTLCFPASRRALLAAEYTKWKLANEREEVKE